MEATTLRFGLLTDPAWPSRTLCFRSALLPRLGYPFATLSVRLRPRFGEPFAALALETGIRL